MLADSGHLERHCERLKANIGDLKRGGAWWGADGSNLKRHRQGLCCPLLDGSSAPVNVLLDINGKPFEASLLYLAPDICELSLAKLAVRRAGFHLK